MRAGFNPARTVLFNIKMAKRETRQIDSNQPRRKKGKPETSMSLKIILAAYLKNYLPILILCVTIIVIIIAYIKIKKASEIAERQGGIASQAVPQPSLPEIVQEQELPQIASIKLIPPSPVKGSVIKAEVLMHGSNSADVIYQWSKNGEALPETSDTLSGDFKKGDKIYLTATPFNEKNKGVSVTVFTHIFNSPPVISSRVQDSKFNDDFTYQVKAEDPDNDTLTYALLGYPDGMTIDPQTGLIRWTAPSGYKAKVNVLVSVSDGAGGEATQAFNLQFNQEAK